MSMSNQVSKTFSIGGKSFGETRSISGGQGIVREILLNPALTGTVAAAMTSTTTTTTTLPPSGGTVNGTLNLASVAGLSIGQYLDVYWSGAVPIVGACYGATIEDISGTTIFFTGGTLWAPGTTFPSNGTSITCMVPTSLPISFTGNNLQSLVTYTDQPGCFVWDTATRSNAYPRVTPYAAGVDHWEVGGQISNPLAGVNVTQLFVSHGYSGGTVTMRAAVLVNP